MNISLAVEATLRPFPGITRAEAGGGPPRWGRGPVAVPLRVRSLPRARALEHAVGPDIGDLREGAAPARPGALYEQVRVGDPFEITGADATGTVAEGNGYGAWNVAWSGRQAKSALK
ncbi:hypothetical protein [Streptomyces sp. NBC_01618]|uniref:hypothetical protein n=1 Tax=Streptomyces sp. NBC_01618 TaxID=2975900 RepID=UPI003864339E|nr:hypothetical protein OH735_31330 [Streptomyces sp. NBC_01618]